MQIVIMLSVDMLSAIMLIVVMRSVIMLSVIMLSVIMLSVVILSAIMLTVIMLSVIMLSAIMLSVIMPSVIMLSVVILNASMLIVVAPDSNEVEMNIEQINDFIVSYFLQNRVKSFSLFSFKKKIRECLPTLELSSSNLTFKIFSNCQKKFKVSQKHFFVGVLRLYF
jgi:hypothetical protein